MQETPTRRTIVILTNSYPFGLGEPFFETEAHWWGLKAGNCDVWLFPSENSKQDRCRYSPANLKVYSGWSCTSLWRRTVLGLLHAPFHLLTSEVKIMAKKNVLNHKSVLAFFVSCMKTGYHYYTLKKFVKENGNISTIYCYWNNERSYAATLLKRDKRVNQVVSRIHRYDLFEELRSSRYMPLKSSLISRFDEIYPLSVRASDYLKSVYGAHPDQLLVSSLGVKIPDHNTRWNDIRDKNDFSLLSVSNCVPVKRIERIIDGIAIAAGSAPDTRFIWTHIGGGPLLSRLESYATTQLSSSPNVIFKFLGEVANSYVRNFYVEHDVDVFLNSSDSEGVPVAIMEAMSFGIPVIASDVGSVSELVSADNGWLLPQPITADTLGDCIIEAAKHQGSDRKRDQARMRIEQLFDADYNYPHFVNHVMGIGVEVNENNQ